MATRTTRLATRSLGDVSIASRQHLLLNLLDAVGGSLDNQDFQKLLFLYCQEPDSGAPYDFVPYKRGAFSWTSQADLRKLIANGLVEDDEHHWKLTLAGREAVQSDILLAAFLEGLNGLRGDALVADTYRRFPYHASRSEIAHRLLEGDDEALNRIAAAKSPIHTVPLQTIGYEGRSLEAYLNLLLKSGVSALCDVRRNPISRKYGFSKNTLARACAGVGIWYEHLPELGIAAEQRQALNTQADYDMLFSEYERDYLPTQPEALARIQSWIDHGARVALTCYELHPHQCHRHCVAERLQAMSTIQFEARHL